MTDTENDLRAVLLSVVPDDLDVSGFRARLDRLIAEHDRPVGEAGSSSEVDAAPGPLELTAHRRRHGPWGAWAVTAVACAAAVAGIVIAVLPGGTTDPRPASRSSVPSVPRPTFLPGTIVLATVTGSGTRTVDVPRRSVPKNFEYAISATCSGAGKLGISGGMGRFDVSECGGNTVGGYSRDALPDGRPIVVRTGPGTTWRLTIVLQPKWQANADAMETAGDDMTGRDSTRRQGGSGTSTVRFGGPAATHPKKSYRVRLVCSGSGVSMPGLKAADGDGLTTKTCFPDQEYIWQHVDLTLPASVKVVAAAGTTWTVVVG